MHGSLTPRYTRNDIGYTSSCSEAGRASKHYSISYHAELLPESSHSKGNSGSYSGPYGDADLHARRTTAGF